jgi:hypothetical protein
VQEIALDLRDTGVPSGRNADILGEIEHPRLTRQLPGLAVVGDNDDIDLHVALSQHGVHGTPELRRPPLVAGCGSPSRNDHKPREHTPPDPGERATLSERAYG